MRVSGALNKLKKIVLIVVGLLCLGLGILGYIVPGLPGTIWLIIAATLFVRSSDRLYNFVIRNRVFGNQVRGFLETGEMPMKAKILSLISMWAFTFLSVILAPYDWRFKGPILLLAMAGTAYILSRPTQKSDD
ncbi:MAG: YbaN family protein [Chloroflexota bacterium]|jgi:hypothetical protein|nr:YbaN family protein [Chloroflexota bacterium]